jgi:riboflavin kinase
MDFNYQSFNCFHLLILLNLLSNGAKDSHIEKTSMQISKTIGRSQQTAAKLLIDLEKKNFIERIKSNRKFKIKVTSQGHQFVSNLYDQIKITIEKSNKESISFKGKIVSGSGEGSYYMSLNGYKNQFRQKLGYEPYPGTLNVELDRFYTNIKNEIKNLPAIHIQGFKDENRTYGWVKCYPSLLFPSNSNGESIEKENKIEEIDSSLGIKSSVILLERTHHDNSLIEIISPFSIKDTASLKNGDTVTINLMKTNN